MLVEDDEAIRIPTAEILRDEGYDVVETSRGEEALEKFPTRTVDCVLVDLGLPGMDGFDTCRALRSKHDVPIIIVTARDDDFDVVAGLEAGADDYVTKPFEPKVLIARIRALLRRARGIGAEPASVVLGGRVELLPEEGIVRVDGRDVHLTRTEFRLLCELAGSPGRVFSREQLLDSIWGYDYFGETKLVDVHVYRLRAKIEADPSEPVHILTVRGLGYKVVT
jgi:DNA-binding response OmpR family regulator